MVKAATTALWNSSIRFWSCFKDPKRANMDCQIWFNETDPDQAFDHDIGAVKESFMWYLPWWPFKRYQNANYLVNRNQLLAQDRGSKFVIIDAQFSKGTYRMEVSFSIF